MNRTSFLLIVAVAGATMLIGGCSPSAASAPTSASAVATQVKWPASGRSVTAIVPYAPGGTTDISARIVLPAVSSKLGNPVEIVNKPGGGAMVGNTQAATASPDGYTIDYTSIPTMLTNYMDPANKAVFTRTSFAPIARTTFDPDLIAVKADSPYHSLKDLVDAAKANPNTVTVAVAGPLSTNELGVLLLEQAANVSFAHVNFDGGGPGVTALLGGHVQASSNTVSEVRAQVQ
ncbi:MAG: tripartite tricarboxylate transporter substrate binding protein, partial [Actinobacteria bacterium]|nr:tripartite tricarboxylate transporter substrate binding protein [Actinomycetota bacterium]